MKDPSLHEPSKKVLQMKTWACFDDGFKFLALLWAFIEESRLDRPKSSLVFTGRIFLSFQKM